jgi:hypothetical protein
MKEHIQKILLKNLRKEQGMIYEAIDASSTEIAEMIEHMINSLHKEYHSVKK